MHTGPVHADGGRDEDPAWRVPEPEDWQPVITCPDPLTEEEWLASLDATAREDEPPADEEEWAQDWTEDWAEIEASLTAQSATAQFTAAQFTAAAQFATGRPLDVMPGRAELAQFADEAAGPDDSFVGVSEDELLGVLLRVGPGGGSRGGAEVRGGRGAHAPPPGSRKGSGRPGSDARGVRRVHRARAGHDAGAVPLGRR